jgi:NADPH:quinone reductase-like Zn-dependent oxidoreductase
MRAVLYDRYGPPSVLRIGARPDPKPGPGEVLVQVRAASVNPIDFKVRRGDFQLLSGRRFPRTTGSDFSGEVVALGTGVTGLAIGQRVMGVQDSLAASGGSFAELMTVKMHRVVPTPAILAHVDAAALPLAGLSAYQALMRLGRMTRGAAVLIIGASGGVGHLAVQIAKIEGAHVTAVASTRNLAFVESLKPDVLIDYSVTDLRALTDRYDVIFDAVTAWSLKALARQLQPNGTYVSTLPGPSAFLDAWLGGLRGLGRQQVLIMKADNGDLEKVAGYAAAGFLRPHVERVYDLAHAADAHASAETGRTVGKLVVTVP